MVEDGSMFTEDPDDRLPPGATAPRVAAVVTVPVASSVKVPPVDSKTRSAASDAVGTTILNVPSVAVVAGPATVLPLVSFAETEAASTGAAKTDPVIVVVAGESEDPPPHAYRVIKASIISTDSAKNLFPLMVQTSMQ